MLTVNVPLNTMLADLDETLRGLLKEELERARLRGRRHRLRRALARMVGPALQADGQPLPLRPARGRGPAHERVVADPARRAHVRGASADGHGVLLRGDRVDAGRRGRAPAALAGALDLLRVSPRFRRTSSTGGSPTARRPGRSRAGSGRARARSPTSGARSAGSTRCRSTTSSGCRSIPAPSLERGPEVRTQTDAHAPVRRPGAHRARDAPVGRPGAEQEGRAARRRLGHPARRRHLDFERRGRALPLRSPAAGPTPAAGADGRRPRGRRAARSSRARESTW